MPGCQLVDLHCMYRDLEDYQVPSYRYDLVCYRLDHRIWTPSCRYLVPDWRLRTQLKAEGPLCKLACSDESQDCRYLVPDWRLRTQLKAEGPLCKLACSDESQDCRFQARVLFRRVADHAYPL
ncbi:hypothetical protein Mp_Vg01065 [Marchantia polymorpha subsp. ruderalis]|nr:hypothetical protein Mp_Vg01065 [Marchantia polymorpha subsp. ruderalis]